MSILLLFFFFFNDTATTEIYTLSLHDALPICIPDWAKQTLREHQEDEREHLYTREELEGADTHDPYWNAAMTEAARTGYVHNHMRMYWGKKILRSEEHTSELQSRQYLVCRLLLEKKKYSTSLTFAIT